jgi:transposase
MDRRLIERTIELAAQKGTFGSRQLRAALDSSPLWGAGRVEDTYNLLGHASR